MEIQRGAKLTTIYSGGVPDLTTHMQTKQPAEQGQAAWKIWVSEISLKFIYFLGNGRGKDDSLINGDVLVVNDII